MVENILGDGPAINIGTNHDGRHPNTQVRRTLRMQSRHPIYPGVAAGRRSRRRHVVEESSVLVVRDNDHHLLPLRRSHEKVDRLANELLPSSKVSGRMIIIGGSDGWDMDKVRLRYHKRPQGPMR